MRDKAFNIARSPKYDGYQRRLAWMVYKFFDKKTSSGGIKNENIPNKESLLVIAWFRVQLTINLASGN